MSFQVTHTLDLGVLGEAEVTVEYDYSPGRPGKMYLRNGDPGYPPEPALVDIISILWDGHNLIKIIPQSALSDIQDTILSNHSEA